jgi:hypothetical protein
MTIQLPISTVISELGATFRSIEVRTLSFELGERCNVVTALRFAPATEDEVTADLDQLVTNLEPIRDQRLQFHWKCVAMSDWEPLAGEFQRGALSFGERVVNLMRPVDLPAVTGWIGRRDFLQDDPKWPTFGASEGWNLTSNDPGQGERYRRLQYFGHDPELLRLLSTSDYHGLRDVFVAHFGPVTGSDPTTAGVYVAAPVFVAIGDLRFDPSSRKLQMRCDAHPLLRGKLRIYGRANQAGNQRWEVSPTTTIKFGLLQPAGNDAWTCEAEADANIDDSVASVQINVTHEELGPLTSKTLPSAEVVPRAIPDERPSTLWHLLQAFCPSDEFLGLITNPRSSSSGRQSKPQREFERHIGWLLGLFGFVPLVLGRHEPLRAPDSLREQGSLDILAFHPKRRIVLLAGCTTAPPKEDDYANLVNVRAILGKAAPPAVDLPISLAIFTAAAECVPPPRYGRGCGNYIAVFVQRDMHAAVEQLRGNKDEEFFRKLDDTTEIPAQAIDQLTGF